jgi:hypothetical protein
MYALVLTLHSYARWMVILAGFMALIAAGRGLAQGLPWDGLPKKMGRFFGIAVDVQFLLGAALYLLFSPMTTVGLNLADGLPSGSELRFFGVYHGLIMTTAFVDVHVSAVFIRRGATEQSKYRRSVILYGQTLLIILCAIPWWRPWLRA